MLVGCKKNHRVIIPGGLLADYWGSLGALIFISALILAFFAPLKSAVAQEMANLSSDAVTSADLVRVSTPVYPANRKNFIPKLGNFTYEAAWQGIPAADIDIEVSSDGLHYFVNVSAKTLSAIDIFYRMRYEANGVMNASDFSPLKSTFDQKENSRARITEITFMNSGEVRSYRKRKDKDAEIMQFDPKNFMLDPFSAIFLARSLDWKLGDVKKFDVFNGKSRYLITLTAVEKTSMEVNGVTRDVWVISPAVDNLTAKKANKKLREARIYITDDSNRDVVKIASSVFIGEVTATLKSFSDYSSSATTTMAKTGQDIFLK